MSSAKRNRGLAAARIWRSLGLRLAIWYVGVTLISYLALAAILPMTVRAWADTDGQRTTEGVLERYRRALDVGGTDALRAMFDCHEASPASVAVRLSDERDVELFHASSDASSEQMAATMSEQGAHRLGQSNPPIGWHSAALSVSEGRQLEVLLHDETPARLWSHARSVSLLTLACGLASAILGAFIITRRALRPIGELSAATQAVIDSGNLALRVPTRGSHDSLDQLGLLFNRMLARNETLVRAMKESLDNVAHDLRTPLTRLRAGAELALQGVSSRQGAAEAGGREHDRDPSEARVRLALAETIEETDVVLSMLTTMMDISEAEVGAMRLDRCPEDLAAIVREAIDLYDLVSQERGVQIVTHLTHGVLVSADRARIRQACANLLDNALKYTPAGGRVEVTVRAHAPSAILTIADTGLGISSSDIPRVWDRLYRGDRSRAERGLGLGLSLVKAIVEAHGGEVQVQSEEGKGSSFEVRLHLLTPARAVTESSSA